MAGRSLARIGRDSRGNLLLDAMIGITVFALVGVAVLVGLNTTYTAGAKVEDQSVAENIARNQMEHVFNLVYQPPPATYDTVATPTGYSVTAEAEEFVVSDPNIEKVIVTVSRDGQSILVLETIRTN